MCTRGLLSPWLNTLNFAVAFSTFGSTSIEKMTLLPKKKQRFFNKASGSQNCCGNNFNCHNNHMNGYQNILVAVTSGIVTTTMLVC